MPYDSYTWVTGDPITQEKMNRIEQGIVDAHSASSTNASNIYTILNTTIPNINSEISNAKSSIEALLRNTADIVDNASLGALAWSYVLGAMPHTGNTVNISLDARIGATEGYITAMLTEISAARKGYGNLVSKIDQIDTNLSGLAGSISTINDKFANASGPNHDTVEARLESDESRISANENSISTMLSEIVTARGVNGTSLNARFGSIESEISTARGDSANLDGRLDSIESDITSLGTNKMDKSSRVNNLTTETAGFVLDATQGRELDLKKIDKTDIYNDLDYTQADKVLDARQGKELADRISAISDPSTGSIAGLNTRLTALETEVDMESTNSRIDTLATAMSAAEGNINTLNSTISNATTGLAATKAIADEAKSIAEAAKSTADAAATASDLTTLAGRVTTLENEPKSATTIVDSVTYDSTTGKPTNISNPSTDVDYLLKKDDKYYYWKYIETGTNTYSWELISGGGEGGSGTSSAEFYSALTAIPEPYSDTVDYFIGSGANYIHYRYLNNTWVQILPAHLINSVTVDTSQVVTGEGASAITTNKSRPIIKEIDSETNLLASFNAVQSFNAEAVTDGYKLTWVNIDGEYRDIVITGGSGGSNVSVNVSIDRIGDSNITTISGEACSIGYTFNATEPGGSTYETIGQGTWTVNGARVATLEVSNGNNTFNIQPYLNTGTNNITLAVTINVDGQNITRTKTWVVNVINFSLVWNYEESNINTGSTINFTCTPYGTDITKTLYLKVGLHEQHLTVTTSGIPVTVVLENNFEHGNYTAEMWMTATINSTEKTTPHISHDFIVVEQGNTAPIIAATLPSSTVNQYDTITIPFVVYTPTSSLSTVVLAVDGVTQDTRTDVGRSTQTWNYTPSTLGTDIVYDENEKPLSGTHTLTITSGSTTKTLTLTVNSIDINNDEIGGYAFKLKASELPSNSALLNWKYGNDNSTKLLFSNNFDWINGGIQTERDANNLLRQYIRVKSGTTMTIPYKMFYGIDPRINGSNFKIIFKVENCRNYDAIVATTVADNIGIQLNAHNATFKSTTTQISTQYGENDYTELEFEVYKNHLSNGDEAANPYMMAWIDGVMTSARPYDGNFVLTEVNAKNIVIGSTDCDVCVYLVKYYPTVLSIADHISNFIADAPNAVEMIRRYNRNDILDDDGDISFSKLADKNRDCRVWLYDIPRMTTGKKDYVAGVEFLQIYKNGTAYQDGLHGKGTLTVQGTSSVNYRKGAANTDINFYDTKDGRLANCELFDGEGNNLLYDVVDNENVAKPIAERGYKINTDSTPITYSNMKVNFASCEQVNNMCNAEWYQLFQPYPSLSTRDCMEFAMGVQFIHDKGEGEPSGEVILFNEKGANRNPNKYYMYSIGNLGTSKKNTHIFHSDNECCVEVNNNENAGCRMISVPSDLDADYTAYQNGNYEAMSNYDWSGDIDGKDHSYGMRFPDVKNPDKDVKAGWARFVKWMAENNPSAATNAALSTSETYAPYTFRGHVRQGTQVLRGTTVSLYAGEYTTDSFERRMAKMLSECEDYIAMDSAVYHFLFIERHTMVDNVSKNTFWSAAKTNKYVNGVEQDDTEGYWIWDLSKNYDNDTSDGNNNEGQLIFDYGNEAADRQDGKAVFNASDAVWFVFISNLYEACQTMFQNREGAISKNGKWQNAWNASAYHNYLLSELQKIPERVWNECYWYDYLRTYETGKVREDSDTGQIIDKSWITFLDGGQKTHQRWHYETFEELYDASKYRSNFSTANSITLRGYTPDNGDPSLLAVPAKSEIAIKMYNKCYLTAHFGNNILTQKVQKGVLTTLQFLEDNEYMTLSDTVINVDTASMILEIGDLAPLYPGQASFSAAIRLRSIKIGDSTPGYNNPHITNTETGTVDFGANYMLEHLEVQNLSNANLPLNLSGCPALSYLDARGSSFTSITFANGGLLTEAYINNPASLVMRNLDLLTLSNFHITDPTALTQLRLEGCLLFDKKSFVEELTNLNIIRLTGINWTLNNNTLLESLFDMMGMNELGYTISQSYLSGNVSLTGTVYEGDYDKYINAWSPDLSIDYSNAQQFIRLALVTYYNEDGTKLYETYINNGSRIIDPYYEGLLDSAPTKDPDIQYRYRFGSTDNALNYLSFSGWRLSTEQTSIYSTYGAEPAIYVNGEMSLYAVYSSSNQLYTVRWLVGDTVIKTATNQRYGQGYDLVAPTIKEVLAVIGDNTFTFQTDGVNCTYSIMTGWEKLPTNITPTQIGATYDILAAWLRRTNVNYNTVLTSNDYSVEEKLLVLKRLPAARDTLSTSDIFPVKLGYDGIKESTNLLYDNNSNPSGGPVRYNGVSKTINQYTPFGANLSFTIAIDYKFEYKANAEASEAVLISCYGENGDSKQGFKLYYNPNSSTPVPRISFGSTAEQDESNRFTLGSSINNRGMVVLRHKAGDPNLYVYTGSDSTELTSTYSNNAFRKSLPWSAISMDNAKIVLGGIVDNDSSTVNATGTLYSVRYWNEDLGEGECTLLANWCHETVYFAVEDFNGLENHSAINSTLTANLVLHAMNASEMGVIEEFSTRDYSTIGWENSNTRAFYNNRIYQALPVTLQSILTAQPIAHRKAQGTESIRINSSGSDTTYDYVFAPSCVEAGATGSTVTNHNVESLQAFPWYISGLMNELYYNNGSFVQRSSGQSSPNYTNLRFPYQYNPVNHNINVYTGYPFASSSFYTAIDGETNLHTGDILIPNDSTVAYIFVGAADINRGAPLTTDNYSFLDLPLGALGGWVASSSWWTRSVPDEVGRSTNYPWLIFVNAVGLLVTSGRGTKQGIVYSIAL